ncbi:MAG: phosphatase PAP2 family protein [Acidimicrobiaceae bacterium]|nr:phosphatase PAP2 family protein [Acidimicrobiaceae bacterium]
MRVLSYAFRVETRPGARDGRGGLWQLLFAVAGLALYEIAHLLTDSRTGSALDHARDVLRFEHVVGIDWEHAAQAFTVSNSALRMWGNGVYTWMYWPVIIGALVLTWFADRRYYVILRDGMLLSGAAGLLVFIFYPVAPPRMLSGFVDTISGGSVDHSVVHGSIADAYAALPSFHVGWVALAAMMVALTARRPIAVLLAMAVTAAMAAAVVVTANHFVLDGIAGIAVAAAGGVVAARLHLPVGATAELGQSEPRLSRGA